MAVECFGHPSCRCKQHATMMLLGARVQIATPPLGTKADTTDMQTWLRGNIATLLQLTAVDLPPEVSAYRCVCRAQRALATLLSQ
jgi:hypothetical protein